MWANIHDLVSQREKLRRSEWLSKKIGEISIRGDKRHNNLIRLDKFTDEIMSSIYVLCPAVILGVIGGVYRGFVV